jgi:hypothetical protein
MNASKVLEQLVDTSDLAAIVNRLADICYEKSQHISENWQDNILAGEWERAGNKLAAVSLKIPDFLLLDANATNHHI